MTFKHGLAVLSLAVLTSAASLGAQGVTDASVNRGPRFLYAPASNAAPVGLDVKKTPILSRRISLDLRGVTLESALAEISSASGLKLSYSKALVPLEKKVRLVAEEITVAGALSDLLFDVNVDILFTTSGQAVLVPRTNGLNAPVAVGNIGGFVTDSATNSVIAGAAVVVEGTKLVATTNAEGAYSIKGIPVGTYTVSARRLGYARRSRVVNVMENATVSVNVTLARVPTMLTEVVSTATGDRQRLEIGNSIGTIKADSVVSTTLIRNMSDLLQARVTGVVVSNTSGLVGAPSKVRVRGLNSIDLNNDPVIIMDGVRLASQTTENANQTNNGSVQMLQGNRNNYSMVREQRAPSRFDDIDPSIIESIDVLRGPSAASLYGTDAANGVIVIKTKRGTASAWRSTISADHQYSEPQGKFPETWFGWGRVLGNTNAQTTEYCLIASQIYKNIVGGTCIQDSITNFNPQNHPEMKTIGTGTGRAYRAQTSGGSDRLQQFLSVSAVQNVGMAKMSNLQRRITERIWTTPIPSWMLRPNTESNVTADSRTTFALSPKASISLTTAGGFRSVLNGGSGIEVPSRFRGASLADSLGFLPSDGQRAKQTSDAKRASVAVSTSYMPTTWLSLSVDGGGDYTERTDGSQLRAQDCTLAIIRSAFSDASCPSFRRTSENHLFVRSINGRATFTFQPWSWLDLRTTMGEQYQRTTFYGLKAANGDGTSLQFGSDLLNSPSPNYSGAQLFNVGEDRDEAITAGWYVEQGVGVFGIFTSFGLREDASSAFGTARDAAPKYPKLSFSYPISEKPYFPRQPYVSSLRLRYAYGHSGNQASRSGVLNNYYRTSYNYTNSDKLDAIGFGNRANPDLKPERGREWEAGFDVSFFENERLRAEITHYRKYTQDAITEVTYPTSFGYFSSGYENLGNVENKGAEYSITALPLDNPLLSWSVSLNYTRNRNKLLKKSPSKGELWYNNARNREGYPLFGYWGNPIEAYHDTNGDGIIGMDEITYAPLAFFGAPYPGAELTYNNSMTLWGGAIQLTASVDQILDQATAFNTYGYLVLPRAAVDRNTPFAEQAGFLQSRQNNGYFNPASSVRLNEVSATFNAPQKFVRRLMVVRSASMTINGRNLALWTNYVGKDPNVDTSGGDIGEVTEDNGNGLAQPRVWALRFNFGF